jgi:hypothetical protein
MKDINQIIEELREALHHHPVGGGGNLKVEHDQDPERPEIIVDVDGYFTAEELQIIATTAKENNLVIQPASIKDEEGQEIENEYRLYLFRTE